MLEQKYSTTSMTELIKMVLLEGNLEALIECQNRVRGFEYDMTTMNPLDALLLYYVDLVWMPEDLRHEFVDLHGFIIMDIKNILTNHQYKNLKDVKDLYVLLFSLNNELETDEDVHLCDFISKALYLYTNGKYGFDVNIQNADNILHRMVSSDYSRIPDDALKLLCLVYYMRNDIFTSKLEKELFEAYMARKRFGLLQAGDGNEKQHEIFDKQSEIFLVD